MRSTILKYSFYLIIALGIILITTLYAEINYQPKPYKYSGNSISDSLLLNYYVDFTSWYTQPDYRINNQGIPVYAKDSLLFDHPVLVSHLALGAHEVYLSNKTDSSKNKFLQCANWLQQHLTKDNELYFWNYYFTNQRFPGGSKKLPWHSAMAQGMGASVLLRAFQLTLDSSYLQSAEMALISLKKDLQTNGVSVIDTKGQIFPQEYITKPNSHILNGAIFAYWGVYDYYRITGDMKNLNNNIANTLANALINYDSGYWSYYCQWPTYLASPKYHALHIHQLKMMEQITQQPIFGKLAIRFNSYQNSTLCRLKYVINNHWRHLNEFSISDLNKLPAYLKRTF